MNYYNEHDKQKAAWLRELIARDLIAPGEVDERSIVDVQPGDLHGYRQCHFFAGIGVWSYALRLAGWPANRPVWTASCPCQPFSAAGKRKGTADHRHLWPELFRLIQGCRPVVALGEQVAGKDGLAWLDIVRTDLDQCGYTCGRVVSPACGYGAPHRRERLYWCALADHRGAGLEEWRDGRGSARAQCASAQRSGAACRLEHPAGDGREPRRAESGGRRAVCGCGADGLADEPSAGLEGSARQSIQGGGRGCGFSREPNCVVNSDSERCAGRLQRDGEPQPRREASASGLHAGGLGEDGLFPGAVRGAWAGANWILARPQRVGDPLSLRPVESGSFPLADGSAARVVRLRGYGDAIVATQAQAFIEAVMEEYA